MASRVIIYADEMEELTLEKWNKFLEYYSNYQSRIVAGIQTEPSDTHWINLLSEINNERKTTDSRH